jgi:O-antigen ligase
VKYKYQIFKQNIKKYINYLAVIFAFGLGLAKFLVPISGALIVLLWIIEGDFKRKFRIIIAHKSLLVFFIFIFYLFLTLYISADINYYDMSRHFWAGKHETPLIWYIKHYVFYSFILMALVTSLEKEFVKYVFYGFILGMTVNVFISFLMFFKFLPLLHGSYNLYTPLFINHSYYSAFLCISIFILLIMIHNKMINNWLGMFIIAVFTFNLFINNGRIGQLAFFIEAIIASIYLMKINLKKFISVALILITVLGITIISNKNLIDNFKRSMRSVNLIKQDYFRTPIGERIALDIVGIKIFKQYPVFGVGIDEAMNAKNYYVVHKEKKFYFLKKYLHFHNNYIQYLVEGGIIGLGLFILFFIFIFFEKSYELGKDIKYLVMPIFIVFCFTEVPFLRERSFALFVLFYSILLLYSSSGRETSNIDRDSV